MCGAAVKDDGGTPGGSGGGGKPAAPGRRGLVKEDVVVTPAADDVCVAAGTVDEMVVTPVNPSAPGTTAEATVGTFEEMVVTPVNTSSDLGMFDEMVVINDSMPDSSRSSFFTTLAG